MCAENTAQSNCPMSYVLSASRGAKSPLRFGSFSADKPAAVATDAKQRAEISSLNLCRGAKEGNCKLSDAHLASP